MYDALMRLPDGLVSGLGLLFKVEKTMIVKPLLLFNMGRLSARKCVIRRTTLLDRARSWQDYVGFRGSWPS